MGTIADRLRPRLLSNSKIAKAVVEDQARVVPVVEKAAQQLDEIETTLEELAVQTGAVKSEIWAAYGVMAENQEFLEGLRDHIKDDATLVANFTEVFIKRDPQLLAQSLKVSYTEVRREALLDLSMDELQDWLYLIEEQLGLLSDDK